METVNFKKSEIQPLERELIQLCLNELYNFPNVKPFGLKNSLFGLYDGFLYDLSAQVDELVENNKDHYSETVLLYRFQSRIKLIHKEFSKKTVVTREYAEARV